MSPVRRSAWCAVARFCAAIATAHAIWSAAGARLKSAAARPISASAAYAGFDSEQARRPLLPLLDDESDTAADKCNARAWYRITIPVDRHTFVRNAVCPKGG